MRTWIIGSAGDCDLVVAKATVSGRHCRLTEMSFGYLLEDLGSSNGTYVNGERIAAAVRVSPTDTVTLGLIVPLPWPQIAAPTEARFVRIGRNAANEIVLDDPRVSGHHARLVIVVGSPTLIEDIGSSNGTCVNSVDQGATQPVPLQESDTVYFGTLAVPAARLLARARELEPEFSRGRKGDPYQLAASPGTLEQPSVAAAAEPPTSAVALCPQLGSDQSAAFRNLREHWRLVAFAQAPVLGLIIVLLLGRQAGAPLTPQNQPSVRLGIGSTTFSLALAALWLGCSVTVGEMAAGRWVARQADVDTARFFASVGRRFGVLASLGALECAVLLAIVYWGNGLKGPPLAMWGVMVMVATVGMFLASAVTVLAPTWAIAAAGLFGLFVPMVALGGRLWPLPDIAQPARFVAYAMPSRWAFEGLLLLESSVREPTVTGGDDLAASFFPADSERMGPKADALALGSMLLGLAATAVFISSGRHSVPRPP
jgi:pSer/pThr/pTyr-binding forkhead associated (FHA) protein